MPMHSTGDEGSRWFWDHYEGAAGQVISFFEGDGISLTGRRVGDIGCGDGIIDLGVAHHAAPAQLVGFDINPTDRDRLAEMAASEGVEQRIPDCLEFRESEPTRLPAEDNSFDLLFTWSAFEHVADSTALLRDMHRILVPDGVLMLQLWPFFHSQHGSHLWRWFPEGFIQLLRPTEEIEAVVRAEPKDDPGWAEYMLGEYRTLNRITVDELQRCLLAAGFRVSKLQLEAGPVHIPPELSEQPLSLLGIAGVKLLATPAASP
jgi:SAM-dependent methyltransferase